MLQRKEQGDVDVDALGEKPLDRGPPLPGAGHLDHEIGAIHGSPEPPRFGDRLLGLTGERGRDLQ